MNGKWWRWALLGILLFDLCLFAVRTGPMSNGGRYVTRLMEGISHQSAVQDASFDPGSARTRTAGNLTVTTVFLLTAMTLL
jgi:hypothetical protein